MIHQRTSKDVVVFQKYVNRLLLSEEETRTIIDEKLRQAGWEADSVNLTFQMAHVQKRDEIWRSLSGLLKVVEQITPYLLVNNLLVLLRLKQNIKIASVLDSQTKFYARNVYQHEDETLMPTTGEYKAPFYTQQMDVRI